MTSPALMYVKQISCIVSVLKTIGRHEKSTDDVKKLLDPNFSDNFLIVLEGHEHLLLYDIEFDSLRFSCGPESRGFVEGYVDKSLNRLKTTFSVLKAIKEKHESVSKFYEFKVKSQNYSPLNDGVQFK